MTLTVVDAVPLCAPLAQVASSGHVPALVSRGSADVQLTRPSAPASFVPKLSDRAGSFAPGARSVRVQLAPLRVVTLAVTFPPVVALAGEPANATASAEDPDTAVADGAEGAALVAGGGEDGTTVEVPGAVDAALR